MPENKSTDNFEFSIKTHSNLKFSGAGFVLLKLCPYCNYLQYIKFDFVEQKFSPFIVCWSISPLITKSLLHV